VQKEKITENEKQPVRTIDEIDLYIRARYPIIYVVTWEEKRGLEDLRLLAAKQGKALHIWSVSQGFTTKVAEESHQKTKDPIAVLNYISQAKETALFVLKDFHHYMGDPSVIRAMRDCADALRTSYKTLILISPVLRMPIELEKDLTVVDYKMPGPTEMRKLLDGMIDAVIDNPRVTINLTNDGKEKLLRSALGLTAIEAENAFSRVIVDKGRLSEDDIQDVLEEKRQIVRKSGLLEFYEVDEKFDQIGGLKLLKDWLIKRGKSFDVKAREYGLPEPRGALLVGVQGCGKSLTAKAVSTLWRLPLLRLDLGKLFSGIIGSSEENMRKAIQIAESLAPSILWLDEVEKGLSGLESSAVSDAGTASRVFGTFITWLQEKKSPVFVIATANDIDRLPPELMRKGRFDEIFFIDLPNLGERREIFDIHITGFGRDPDGYNITGLAQMSRGFSGAEIKESVIAAMYDGFSDTREFTFEDISNNIKATVPISKTMHDQIKKLRSWAGVRARRASLVEAGEAAPEDDGTSRYDFIVGREGEDVEKEDRN
jgi:SpoVK/Ycf46/Vps4 family AAA+-type ATPase